jgi:uncharacterized protein with PIN domain
MAKAEAVIEELLAKRTAGQEASLQEIEQAVLGTGQAWEQAVTAELVAESGQALPETWPRCPDCGQRLKAKGKRNRRLVTQTGEVSVVRAYYHCAACGKGLFPPG